jgi:hypothetical protein
MSIKGSNHQHLESKISIIVSKGKFKYVLKVHFNDIMATVTSWLKFIAADGVSGCYNCGV